ncbi:hypothetical protein ABB37_10148 [Leptomonas pyrrhocoris]|uniref:Uncharacterized protein n=1 Tax=Leptomonas pyrrhocoris TaxID=157538 RepID=A0A0M9FP78_LEPPY|nr:hypothetical protein ABB37_10148 [Leptomonas pyrrhocoris]KPA73066.1 hypothetical protein ABB37_10148 [Leptomonas pyrrhocoris]|eukprot:XP_015651505.1 hypothetical protein ABB37_10148 [Leptomonas pyrrhocoris]
MRTVKCKRFFFYLSLSPFINRATSFLFSFFDSVGGCVADVCTCGCASAGGACVRVCGVCKGWRRARSRERQSSLSRCGVLLLVRGFLLSEAHTYTRTHTRCSHLSRPASF